MERNEFALAFESGYASTRRFLMSRGAQMEEADEIAQAAWVRGWEYRQQLRDPSLIGYWVNSIARNLFRARFRSVQPLPLEGMLDPAYTMGLEDDLEVQRLLEKCAAKDRALLEILVAPQVFARPFAAPPGIPDDRARALRDAFDKTVRDPAFIEEAEKQVLEPDLVDHRMLTGVLEKIYTAPKPLIERARKALEAGQ